MLKRFSAICVVLGLSTSLVVQADTTINVPQLAGGFFAGLSGLFFQPSPTNRDLDDGVINSSEFGTSALTEIQNIEPSYRWGWGIDAGYVFPCTANDITAQFWQLNAFGGNVFVQQNVSVGSKISGSIANNDTTVNGDVKYNIDQVNLLVGQWVQIGSRLSLHASTGLEWAEVDRTLQVNTDTPRLGVILAPQTPLFSNSSYRQNSSNFEGVGPSVGTQAQYYLGDGFALLAAGNAAVLIGSINSDVFFNSITISNPDEIVLNESGRIGSTRRMAPEWDAKLGGIYNYWFDAVCQRGMSLEAGWQFTHYYNVIDRARESVTIPPVAAQLSVAAPLFQATTTHATSDLAVQGPYITVTAHF